MLLQAAVAEIARTLKPGGVFCGTTFLNPQVLTQCLKLLESLWSG